MPPALSQTIDLRPESSLSFTHDAAGLAQQRLRSDLWLSLSLSFTNNISLDLDYIVEGTLTAVSLRGLDDLRREVGALPSGVFKTDLHQALDAIEAAIDTIRGMADPISINALEDELEIIEDQFNDHFIDPVEEEATLPRAKIGVLLALAGPIEDRYDSLEYIASRVRLHARDAAKPSLASLLRGMVLHLANGDKSAYIHALEELLVRVEEYRGEEIRGKEADRIRGRGDRLLRRIAERGIENLWRLELVTTVAGFKFDGTLSWSSDEYLAPTRDMRTQDVEFAVGFDGGDWEISARYDRNDRTNPDRLEHDDDRIIHSIDLSLSHKTDPWDMAVALLFDDTFYPNDIDDEIESERVADAKQAIARLINEVNGLGLSAAVQRALLKELEDALAALLAADRREAVDQLEDFIDEVYDAEWDGQIRPAAARILIDSALAILPRRRIKQLKVPVSLDLPFYEGEMQIEFEKEKTLYPANSRLDRAEITGEVLYTREVRGTVLSGKIRQQKLTYPHAETRNRSREEWEAKVVAQPGWGELALTFFQQETTYAHNAVRDRRVRQGDSTFAFKLAALDLTVRLTERATDYPNDPGRPHDKRIEMKLDASWNVENGTFTAELDDKRRTAALPLADEVLISEQRRVKLSWNGNITDDLEISLSTQWTRFIDWDEPEKDRRVLTIEIEFDLAL